MLLWRYQPLPPRRITYIDVSMIFGIFNDFDVYLLRRCRPPRPAGLVLQQFATQLMRDYRDCVLQHSALRDSAAVSFNVRGAYRCQP